MDGQPMYMEQQPVQYVTADGQPVYMEQQPVQYVTADGQPIQYEVAAPAPSVFNITPEQFAILANGGTLPPEVLNGMLGGGPSVAAAAAPAVGAPDTGSF